MRRAAWCGPKAQERINSLSRRATESDLQTVFEGAGQVSTVNIIRDRATRQARGFAFVEMTDVEGARRAIEELDHYQMGGRNLTVNEAKPPAGVRDLERSGALSSRRRRCLGDDCAPARTRTLTNARQCGSTVIDARRPVVAAQ